MCRLPTRPAGKSRRASVPGPQFGLPNVTLDEFLSGGDWDSIQFPELCDVNDGFAGRDLPSEDPNVLGLKSGSFDDSRPGFDVGYGGQAPVGLKTEDSELDLLDFLSTDTGAASDFLDAEEEYKDGAQTDTSRSAALAPKDDPVAFELQCGRTLQNQQQQVVQQAQMLQYSQNHGACYPAAVAAPECGYGNYLPPMVQPLPAFNQLPQAMSQPAFTSSVVAGTQTSQPAAPPRAPTMPITGRRHAKSQEEIEYQQERVKKRRRESAQRSRARKNCYMKTLEIENKALKLENDRLRVALSKYEGHLNSSFSSPDEVQYHPTASHTGSASHGSAQT